MRILPKKLLHLSLVFLLGCAQAGAIIGAVGPSVCAAFAAITGSHGEYWGTACKDLVKAIADEIEADAHARARAATAPCNQLVPVPKDAPVAWVCPGYEEPAARGIAKKRAAPAVSP